MKKQRRPHRAIWPDDPLMQELEKPEVQAKLWALVFPSTSAGERAASSSAPETISRPAPETSD